MTYKTFTSKTGDEIAYHKAEGVNPDLPGVIFLGGFMSNMEGSKATYLEEQCKARGQAYVRFDYSGHGKSSGNFNDGTIGKWASEAIEALDNLTDGKQIVVGSSMGGWTALILSLKRPEKLAGLIGIAASPDFSEEIYDLLNDEQKAELEEKEIIYIPSSYAEPYPITKDLIEDGRNNLLLTGPININCPVRLLHGKDDNVVPWEKSIRIKKLLTSDDVETIFVDKGDHSLSRGEDLILLNQTIESLMI